MLFCHLQFSRFFATLTCKVVAITYSYYTYKCKQTIKLSHTLAHSWNWILFIKVFYFLTFYVFSVVFHGVLAFCHYISAKWLQHNVLYLYMNFVLLAKRGWKSQITASISATEQNSNSIQTKITGKIKEKYNKSRELLKFKWLKEKDRESSEIVWSLPFGIQ